MTHKLAQIWRWARHEQRAIWFEYLLFSLVILLPLLLPGFILTLDMVFTPRLPWPSELGNTYVFELLLHMLNLVVPADVLQKILLATILVLSGVGAHRLLQLVRLKSLDPYMRWGAYFAGLFYMINPFTYSRFMAGQYLVLLGYAMLPFFVRAVVRLLAQPSLRTALVAAAWATAIAAVSLHHIGMMALVLVLGVVAALWRYRARLPKLRAIALWAGVGLLVTLAANSYWLVPTALGATPISQATAQLSAAPSQAFATSQGTLGALGNVLRLQGFWVEERDMYTLPQQKLPGWGLVMLLVWALVGLGIFAAWRGQKFLGGVMAGSAVVGTVLATTPLITWLSGVVPFIAGYREPHKFVTLLALAFAFFGGLGLAALLARLTKKVSAQVLSAVGSALLLLPFLSAPTMLWGFGGQLVPRTYPHDWFAMDQRLAADTAVTNVLFLPWHMYMDFDFAGRNIANPAAKFFEKPVTVSDNPEYKDAIPTLPSNKHRQIESALAAKDPARLKGTLREHGFSHILLAKEHDFANYDYLNTYADFRLEHESPTLKLYSIRTKGD